MDNATMENVQGLQSGESMSAPDKFYLNSAAGGLSQFGDDPFGNIDFARASAINTATFKEKGGKYKREYELKKLFLRYVIKYSRKWKVMENYPKQIKQKPAWFDMALSLFNENEISIADKKKINAVFHALWEYRDRLLPERVMNEEESVRQYGLSSPYYEQPESPGLPIREESYSPQEGEVLSNSSNMLPTQVVYSGEPRYQQQIDQESSLGVRKVSSNGEDPTFMYVAPVRSFDMLRPRTFTMFKPTELVQSRVVRSPQGKFGVGALHIGGYGSEAFSVGKDLLSGERSGGVTIPGMNLPSRVQQQSQPVQQPVLQQREQKNTKSSVDRKMSQSLEKFRSIELPSIPKQNLKMSVNKSGKKSLVSHGAKSSDKYSFDISNIGGNIGKQKVGKMKKGKSSNMNIDMRGNIDSVVGGIRSLRKQVRGELKGDTKINSLNIKNIKSNKIKGNKDLDILKRLKSDTHSQISREALECKMIPKLKAQCDKVFTKNHITSEVKKFREDFKDISKAVPTVKGDKARIREVDMLGSSISHGVEGSQVDGVRSMYKNSGTTKQMSIGKMEYDYSFITGKRKPKRYVEEYEEE